MDLYFAGAKNTVADAYLLEHGCNRLQSQLVDRGNIRDWCEKKSEKSKLFVDSGAYTAYTKGTTVDVDAYIDYLNSITDKLTIFAQVDTIPGRFGFVKTAEDRREAPARSWENYLYMRARLKEPKKLLPIFHQGEDFKWLRNMLEWTDETGEHIDYIGVSPAPDMPGVENFVHQSFEIIKKSSNPNVKTHAFGMTKFNILEEYPYTSADSTYWKMAAAMGTIFSPWGNIYVGDRQLHDKAYILNQPKDAQERLFKYIEERGYTIEDVVKSDKARYLINIKYQLDWVNNFKFRGRAVKKSLF